MRPGSANLKKYKSRYEKSTERNRKTKTKMVNKKTKNGGMIIY